MDSRPYHSRSPVSKGIAMPSQRVRGVVFATNGLSGAAKCFSSRLCGDKLANNAHRSSSGRDRTDIRPTGFPSSATTRSNMTEREDMTDATEPRTDTNLWTRRLPLIVILSVAAIGAFTLRDYLSFQALAENREALIALRDAYYVPTVLAFIAAYVAIVAFSLPGATIATLTGGFLFSTFPGALFNVVGATVGATIIFAAARWGLGDRLAARMDASDGAVKRIKESIDHNQWEALFLIRLVPAVPFFVANIVPALVGVPLFRFVVSTFLGIIPGAVVYTSVGAGLGEVFARGETPDLGVIFEPHILFPILGLCLLAALPIALKALRSAKGA